MKKKTFIISIIAIIAAIGITGWILGIRFAQTPKEESRVHSAETFLDEFFSFNKDGRYTGITDFDMDAADRYYDIFAEMAESECLDQMIKNRIPVKYDKLFSENYEKGEVKKISIEDYADQIYTFQVTVKLIGEEETDTVEFSGQIGIGDNDKIRSLYLSEG